MPATTQERGLKLVRLELPPDVQKQFRIEAAKEGMSMAGIGAANCRGVGCQETERWKVIGSPVFKN